VECLFSVEAMVRGYHGYFRVGVKFCMGPSSLESYLLPSSDDESKGLPMHMLAEEIRPEDGIFSLNSQSIRVR